MLSRPSSATRLRFLTLAVGVVALVLAVIPLASVGTYAAASVLLVALFIITANTAINAQPTGSLGQLLYETEHPQSGATRNLDATNVNQVSPW